MRPITLILNYEGWEPSLEEEDSVSDNGEKKEEFANEAVKMLFSRFAKPLKSAGVSITESEFLDE